VHIYYNKKQTCTVSMQITKQPSIRNITHQMLNAMKSLIHMSSIMHCLKNSSQNLQNQTQSCLHTPIVISIQIRRSRVPYQMVLYHGQQWLIPQTSTQFFHRSFHEKRKEKIEA
jgi:hypothetical protein